MATSQITVWVPEQAVARAHDIFEVMLADWGTASTDCYPDAQTSQPSFPITPVGVAIGPRSTVDRCWVAWNTQQAWAGALGASFAEFLTRPLSVGQPLYFGTPAKDGPVISAPGNIRTAMAEQLFYVFPRMSTTPWPSTTGHIESTALPATLIKWDGTVVNFTAAEAFESPTLDLQFILKPGLPPPPTKRFPYNAQLSGSIGPALTEVAVARFPTFGRKHVHITASSPQANVVYRVCSVRGLNNNVLNVPRESVDGLKTVVNASESVHFHLCDPCADYVTLYATPSVALAQVVSVFITAYD